MRGVEIYTLPHDDMGISGHGISREGKKNRICVKYSEIPEFLYVLAGAVGADFLPKKDIDDILGNKFSSFANEDYDHIATRVDSSTKHFKKVWKMLDDEKMIANEQLRQNFPALVSMKGELGGGWDYLGAVKPTAEYSLMNLLYDSENILMSQAGQEVLMDYSDAKKTISFAVERHGTCVSVALRPYLERKTSQRSGF